MNRCVNVCCAHFFHLDRLVEMERTQIKSTIVQKINKTVYNIKYPYSGKMRLLH